MFEELREMPHKELLEQYKVAHRVWHERRLKYGRKDERTRDAKSEFDAIENEIIERMSGNRECEV